MLPRGCRLYDVNVIDQNLIVLAIYIVLGLHQLHLN